MHIYIKLANTGILANDHITGFTQPQPLRTFLFPLSLYIHQSQLWETLIRFNMNFLS